MSEALVSVIIPSYNRAYCITKAVDSVLAQTHQNLEILVVDDGSTDDTADVMARTYAHEPRVRTLPQPNEGVAGARNHGLRVARGEYIALLDSDDLWLPWKLEAQVRCLEALPEAGMVWTDMDAMNPEGEIVARRYLTTMYQAYDWFSRDDLFERSFAFAELDAALAAEIDEPRVFTGDIFSEMVLGNLVHTSTVLLRRDRLDKVRAFNADLKRSGEDYDFHLRTCREGPVAYLDAASILYQCDRADQLTVVPAYRIDMARNFLATVAPVIARDRARIRLPKIMLDEVLADANAWVATCHAERGEIRASLLHLAASLRHKPGQAALFRAIALNLIARRLSPTVRVAYRNAKAYVKGRS